MADNFGSFVKGALLGAIAGAVAGVLLAPKSGEETRKDLKKLANDWAEKAVDFYEEAMDVVYEKAVALKAVGKRLDEKKYMDIVKEVVDEFKNDKKVTTEAASRLSSQLKRDWGKVQRAWNGEVK